MLESLLGLEWSMTTVYMACAAGGGTVLLLQTLLLLFGVLDADVDVGDAGADVGDGSFSLFSVRAVSSFFTFFGLTGWLGTVRGWEPMLTVFTAVASGVALMLIVGWLMAMQSKLHSEGNLDPENAVGKAARVYLKIPGGEQGFGKIQVKVQKRTAEFSAFTKGDELPTGALVRVERMTTPDTFEVVPLKEE